MARKRPRIYPRTTGKGELRYDVSFEHYDASGKRKPFMRTFKTEKEARQALAEHEARRGKGQESPPQEASFERCAAAWLEQHGREIRPGTLATYQRTLKHHILPYLGKVPTARITLSRLEQHYRDLEDSGVGAGLIRNSHQIVRAILRWAAIHDYVVDASALHTRSPRYEARKMTCWTDEEMARFADAAQTCDYGPLWLVALYTGMRRGELMGLKWKHIDFERATIQVSESRSVVGSKIVEGPTKNGTTRTISVPRSLMTALREHRQRQLRERLRAREVWEDPELVFTNYHGGTVQPASLRSNLAGVLARAALDRIRIHDLRHTHASYLLRHGKSVPEVSQRLGHKDATQTLKVYAHCIPDQHRATADLLEQMFG